MSQIGVARVRTAEDTAEIAATVMPASGTSRVRWSTASPLVRLSATDGERITVTPVNTTDRTEVVAIEASADNGFSSTAYVTVDPPYRASPELAEVPVL